MNQEYLEVTTEIFAACRITRRWVRSRAGIREESTIHEAPTPSGFAGDSPLYSPVPAAPRPCGVSNQPDGKP